MKSPRTHEELPTSCRNIAGASPLSRNCQDSRNLIGRRELRVPVHFPALLTPSDSSSIIQVRVVDMSQSGLGLEMPRELAIGTGVAVDFAYGTVLGVIRHCLPKSGYFRAGLELKEFIPAEGRDKHFPERRDLAETRPKIGLLDTIRHLFSSST